MLLAQLKLLVLISIFLLLPNQVSAQNIEQGTYTAPTPTPSPIKAGPPAFSSYQTDNQFGSFLCAGFGRSQTLVTPENQDGICPSKEIKRDSTGKVIAVNYTYNNNSYGALGDVSVIMASLFNPPTSSNYYLAHLGENLGLVSPAYAQVSGSGESIIRPVFILWQVMRNFSYLLFILIFLGTGFMIMFRQKLNPQTVITVQAALPGLVIGLLLVTFSYFLTALMVDVAFLGIQIVSEFFITASVPNYFAANDQEFRDLANNFDIFKVFFSFSVFKTVGETHHALNNLIGSILPQILHGLALWTVSGGISIIISLVLMVALFVQLARLLFSLINSYLSILVYTIIGPILLLYSSLPGKNGAISTWWRTILGNALVFPAVLAGFLFAGMILKSPPENWNVRPPFVNFNPEILRLVIGFGIMLGITAIPGMVKKAMGVKDIQEIPQAAMGAGSMAAGLVGHAAGAGIKKTLQGPVKAREVYKEAKPLAEYGDPKARDTIRGMEEVAHAQRREGIGGRIGQVYDKYVRGGWMGLLKKPKHPDWLHGHMEQQRLQREEAARQTAAAGQPTPPPTPQTPGQGQNNP
ncbi:MAG: hypothetical protein Q7S88_03540 [Candidatus Daviesbacteria bacterium]|nr:hypothetical protein [Candidatus Daviesbacteria bacterium]